MSDENGWAPSGRGRMFRPGRFMQGCHGAWQIRNGRPFQASEGIGPQIRRNGVRSRYAEAGHHVVTIISIGNPFSPRIKNENPETASRTNDDTILEEAGGLQCLRCDRTCN